MAAGCRSHTDENAAPAVQGGQGGGGGTAGAGNGGKSSKGGSAGSAPKGGAAGAGNGGAPGQGGLDGGGAAGSAGGSVKGGAAGAAAAGKGGGAGKAGSGGGAVPPPVCEGDQDCAPVWEQAASDKLDAVLASPEDLTAFLRAVPKGGDLHNHLSGAVYAETYLGWAAESGNCINGMTFAAVAAGQCSATNQPAPASGAFFDQTVRAWSMEGFVPGGAQSGHEHFFSTFGKFGPIAGNRRDDSIADVAKRAADENQVYVETMFNLGKNIGGLSTDIWMGMLTVDKLAGLYDAILASPKFASELAQDVKVVDDAARNYRKDLGCDGASPPPACSVGVRFIAQVARTGPKDLIFGQLISAFEMAAVTTHIVGANLSSPEDDTTSLNNYDLHMQMLSFLHDKYKVTGKSPLHITLHAGELTPQFLPSTHKTANTFHVRAAVEIAHAERIGHGLDVLSETDAPGLLADMQQRNVLVEVCLSSNVQILEVSGAGHPLSAYLAANVPVAFATDDQGVSRSSLAGEYLRGVQDQKLGYRALKRSARESLEHAFLPGDSLWSALSEASPVADCAAPDTKAVGDAPSEACQAFLDGSERARFQWELERRFRVFESQQ